MFSVSPTSQGLQAPSSPALTLLQTSALALPNLDQPFILYTTENWEMAPGVWGQTREQTFAPVAYLTKQLGTTVRGTAAWFLGTSSSLPTGSRLLSSLLVSLSLSSHHTGLWISYHTGVSILTSSKLQLFHVSLQRNPKVLFGSYPQHNSATLLPRSLPSPSPA